MILLSCCHHDIENTAILENYSDSGHTSHLVSSGDQEAKLGTEQNQIKTNQRILPGVALLQNQSFPYSHGTQKNFTKFFAYDRRKTKQIYLPFDENQSKSKQSFLSP